VTACCKHETSNSIVWIYSWRVIRLSAYQERLCSLKSVSQNLRLLWNTKVDNCVHKSPLPDSIQSQLNLIHNITPNFFKINVVITLPSTLRSPNWSLPFRLLQLESCSHRSINSPQLFDTVSVNLFVSMAVHRTGLKSRLILIKFWTQILQWKGSRRIATAYQCRHVNYIFPWVVIADTRQTRSPVTGSQNRRHSTNTYTNENWK